MKPIIHILLITPAVCACTGHHYPKPLMEADSLSMTDAEIQKIHSEARYENSERRNFYSEPQNYFSERRNFHSGPSIEIRQSLDTRTCVYR